MGFPHGPINTACSESGQKFEFSSITQAQSEQQAKFQQRKTWSTTMGWIYIDNTRLWQFGFKVSSMLETVSPSIFHEVMGLHAMILVSEC